MGAPLHSEDDYTGAPAALSTPRSAVSTALQAATSSPRAQVHTGHAFGRGLEAGPAGAQERPRPTWRRPPPRRRSAGQRFPPSLACAPTGAPGLCITHILRSILSANGWAEAVAVSRTEGPLRALQASGSIPARRCAVNDGTTVRPTASCAARRGASRMCVMHSPRERGWPDAVGPGVRRPSLPRSQPSPSPSSRAPLS